MKEIQGVLLYVQAPVSQVEVWYHNTIFFFYQQKYVYYIEH